MEKIILLIDELVNNGIIVNTDQESIEKLIVHQEQGGSKFISFGTSDNGGSGGGLFSSIFSGAKSFFGWRKYLFIFYFKYILHLYKKSWVHEFFCIFRWIYIKNIKF